MDPNANLEEQASYLTGDMLDTAERQALSSLRRSLQGWLANGGFEPTWKEFPEATKAFRAWQRNMRKFADLAR